MFGGKDAIFIVKGVGINICALAMNFSATVIEGMAAEAETV